MSDPRSSSIGSDSNRGGDSNRNSNNKRSKSQPQLGQEQLGMQEWMETYENGMLEQLQQKMQEELFMLEQWEQELLERLWHKKNAT